MKEKENWLEYDWHVHHADAVFQVDLQYGSSRPQGYDTLLFLTLMPKKEGKAFRSGQLRRSDGLIRRCLERMEHACFVGRIDLEEVTHLYFYTSREDDLQILEELCHKERAFQAECGRKNEPGWPTYEKILYPDAARRQTVHNREQVQHLSKLGDNPAAARRVTLYLFFPTEPQRLLFEQDARLAGFATDTPVFQGELALPYGSAITCVTNLLPRAINEVTARAIRTAKRHGGQLHNWKCAMVPKKNPFGK